MHIRCRRNSKRRPWPDVRDRRRPRKLRSGYVHGIARSCVGPRTKCYKVHLIALRVEDKRGLYLYKARIPAGFLDKFDTPSRFSASLPIVISYYRIPLVPMEGLIKELGHALRSVQRNPIICSLTEDTQQGEV